MQKNSALRFARIAVTAALITYILHKAGLFSVEGWQHLLDTFAHISLPLVLASIGVELLLILSSAFKWYMLLHSRGLPVSLWRLLAYYMIGMFFNLILPTSVGGDVVRMHELGRYTGRYADAVASVFIDRFSGMATLVVLALLAVVANLRLLNQSWLTMGLAIAVGGAAFICWLIIDERPFNLMQRLFVRRSSFTSCRPRAAIGSSAVMVIGWGATTSVTVWNISSPFAKTGLRTKISDPCPTHSSTRILWLIG